MHVVPYANWFNLDRVVTDPSEKGYCGIAIAPGSDEGLVEIEGYRVQGGRVLPMRSNKYTIARVRPIAAKAGASPLVPDHSLDCIRGLSVILFEDPAEMGSMVARPNQKYSPDNLVSPPSPGLLTLVLSVPFVGRRQAKILIQSFDIAANTFGYLVKGVSWQESARRIVRYPGPTNLAATMSADGTLAFYVGGMDNAEEWDALEIYIQNSANIAASFSVDVDTIGELGAF